MSMKIIKKCNFKIRAETVNRLKKLIGSNFDQTFKSFL